MNIEKNGNRWRITKQVDGIRYRTSIDHKPTEKEAEKIIAKYIQEHSGMPQEAYGMTFKEAADAYIKLKDNILSPNTIVGYRKIIRGLPDWFSSKKLDKITALDVQKMINDKAAQVSPKTVRNIHGLISAVLSVYCENLRLHTTMPLKRKFEPYTPMDSEVKMILDAENGSRYFIPYRLAVYGMRKGEICAISSADLEGNWLHINKALAQDPDGGRIIKPIPKTSESIRNIYIDDELADLIRNTDGLIYTGDPDRLTKHLHDVQDKLGIKHFRFHDFRAYYVTLAHKMGIPDRHIMQNCGYSSTYVMNRAYKRTQEDAMEAYNKQIAAHISQGIF